MAWVLEFVAQRPHLALRVDRDGNMLLSRRGVRRAASPLVFSAHMDHPGFRARASRRVNRRWRVSAQFLGGVRPEFFRGARVLFFTPGKELRARITRVRRHPASGELEASLRAERAIPAGAFGMWDLPPFRRASGKPGVLESRAIDDLAGVAAALALLDVIDRIDPHQRVDVRPLFTRKPASYLSRRARLSPTHPRERARSCAWGIAPAVSTMGSRAGWRASRPAWPALGAAGFAGSGASWTAEPAKPPPSSSTATAAQPSASRSATTTT